MSRVHNNGVNKNMALGGTGHTHTQTRFSNFGQECDAFKSHQPTPMQPAPSAKLSVHSA